MTDKELQLIKFAHIFNNPWIAVLFTALAVWVIIWKGIALWKAARNNSNIWFVFLLVLNTMGILEIIYIFFFSNKKEQPKL
jgi:hypothetical protein